MLKPLAVFLIFCLQFGSVCSAQTIKGKKADTIFLEKIAEKDWGQKVYIEPNRGSENYKHLLDFTFDNDEIASLKESYRYLKQHYPGPLKKYNLHTLPKKWVPVYTYKGKYYIYKPDEPGNEGRVIISDSTVIYQWIEPGVLPISSARKTDKNTWLIQADAWYKSPRERQTLVIHVIDPKTMLSVWTEHSNKEKPRFQLYVPQQYADKFDMIVNSSEGGKVAEFPFDKVDYQKLLKNK